jgi:hypothetical protein
LEYADKGLAFYCNHPDVDARQTCNGFFVFFVGDSPFVAFHGNLNYGLNGSWKAKDVLKAFAAYNPRDIYDPSRDFRLGSIEMIVADHNVGIEYEHNSKFIERLVVVRPRQ